MPWRNVQPYQGLGHASDFPLAGGAAARFNDEMDDDHLPRWSGPIVGAALGLLAALAVDGGAEPLPWHWRLVIGLALGTGSGILIALIDPGSASRPPRVERVRRKPVEPDLAEAIEADAPEPRGRPSRA